jgi:hypothetical protein
MFDLVKNGIFLRLLVFEMLPVIYGFCEGTEKNYLLPSALRKMASKGVLPRISPSGWRRERAVDTRGQQPTQNTIPAAPGRPFSACFKPINIQVKEKPEKTTVFQSKIATRRRRLVS